MFGIQAFQLNEEKQALVAEIDQLNRLKAGLKSKYEQEKAAAAAMQRAKLAIEGQWREAEARVDVLQKKLQALLDAQNSAQTDLAKKLRSSETQVDRLSRALAALKEKYDEIVSRYREAAAELKKGEQRIEQLTAENRTLQSSLEKELRTNERYKKHNTQLSELSRELLAKVARERGIGTMVSIDPITKLGQVELEKMIQEYLDRVDDNTVTGRDQ